MYVLSYVSTVVFLLSNHGMPNVTKFKVTLDYFHEGQFVSHSYQPNLRPERPEANCVSNLCIYVACMG